MKGAPFVFLQAGPDLKQGAALLFGGRDTASGDIPFVPVGVK